LRTPASALLFAGFLAVVTRAAPALASDVGPGAAVVTIRHDLPLLLAAQFEYFDVRTNPTIDWVVTDGHDAIAMWHAAERRGIVTLGLHSGRWWWLAAAVKTAHDPGAPWTRMRTPGIDLEEDCDGVTSPDPPSSNSLLADGFIDAAMAHELSGRLPATHTSNIAGVSTCSLDPRYLVNTTGGSEATFVHHEEYPPSWFNWIGRTEADPERETGASPDALYTFSLTARRDNGEGGVQKLVHSTLKPLFDELLPTPPSTLAFSRNSTIDVWFPYVLAKQDHYPLSVSNVTPELSDVPGALKNNVLRFILPAFTLRWGAIAQGVIRGASVEPSDNPAPSQSQVRRVGAGAETLAGVSLGATLAAVIAAHPEAKQTRTSQGTVLTWSRPEGVVTASIDTTGRIAQIDFSADDSKDDSIDLPCIGQFPIQGSHLNLGFALEQSRCPLSNVNGSTYELDDGSDVTITFEGPGDGPLREAVWYEPQSGKP
jgi:hypothetical protein